jgi:hypothetical protein
MQLQALKTYLQSDLGVPIQPIPWEGEKGLPFLLRDRYAFSVVHLLKTKCLLMETKEGEQATPNGIKKHWLMVKEKWDGDVVYITQTISAFNRIRLIEHKVPFIVPGTQMYLPDLGLDLREHVEKVRIKTETISPATQVVILDALNYDRREPRNVNQLAGMLNYTPMTITRVMDEITDLGLGNIQTVGRQRQLAFDIPKKQLWEKAQNSLMNPIFKKVYVQGVVQGKDVPVAGLSALAEYSDLAEPEVKTLAVSRGKFRALQNHNQITVLPGMDSGAVIQEIWRYWPERLAQNGVVDPFSLFLSLKDEDDERVQAALKMMMEKVAW